MFDKRERGKTQSFLNTDVANDFISRVNAISNLKALPRGFNINSAPVNWNLDISEYIKATIGDTQYQGSLNDEAVGLLQELAAKSASLDAQEEALDDLEQRLDDLDDGVSNFISAINESTQIGVKVTIPGDGFSGIDLAADIGDPNPQLILYNSHPVRPEIYQQSLHLLTEEIDGLYGWLFGLWQLNDPIAILGAGHGAAAQLSIPWLKSGWGGRTDFNWKLGGFNFYFNMVLDAAMTAELGQTTWAYYVTITAPQAWHDLHP